ncbi:glycosyltransferase [Patescibacteria group bacterium]
MKKPIKNLHILPSLERIGPVQQVLNITSNLDKERFSPTVVAIGEKGWGRYKTSSFTLESEFRKNNIPIVKLNLKKPWDLILGMPKIYKAIKDINPDVVNTHLLRPQVYGRYVTHYMKKPLVSTIHNEEAWVTSRRSIDRFTTFIDTRSLKHVDGFVAVSQTVKDFFVKHQNVDPEKILVINNGVNMEKFSHWDKRAEMRKSLHVEDDEIVVATVARIDDQKDPLELIKGVAKAMKQNDKIRFFYAGYGPMEEESKKFVEKLGIKDRFTFLGERSDIPDLLSAFDVFVLMSKFEGMPNSLLEAMSSKIPVIATAVSGNKIAVTHKKDGLLIPVSDAEALTKAIQWYIDNPDEKDRLVQTAYETIHENFSARAHAKKYGGFFEKLLEDIKN